MNAETFMENFGHLADAPGGIDELRGMVLQLAILGKLGTPCPIDETADVLLEKIKLEKEKRVKLGDFKKTKKLSPVTNIEFPFATPKGWVVTRLGNITHNVHYGYTASADPTITAVRMLRITDIQNNQVDWQSVPGCEITSQKLSLCQLLDGDLLIARTGGTIGKSYLVADLSVTAVFASYLIRVIPCRQLFPSYIKVFLGSPFYWQQLYAASAGTGQPNVNATSLSNLILPLPPLAEQKRIVAKVDELMGLCDELEAQQEQQQAVHVRLNEAALDRLTTATTPTKFTKAWSSIQTNFNQLYTTPKTIKQLRQAILSLAVRGKLVPQDADDEPAIMLIDRLMPDQSPKRKAGFVRSQENEELFPCPDGWEWQRLVSSYLRKQVVPLNANQTPSSSPPRNHTKVMNPR